MVAPKKYKFFDPDGNTVEIFNLRKFCMDNDLGYSNMNAVSVGSKRSACGYTKWNEGGSVGVGLSKLPLEERFHEQYEPITETGCWIWTGHSRKGTYGNLKEKGKYLQAHRLSYELHRGEIPEGKIICHKCGEPSCVNPEHLYAGTHKENAADRKIHGTHKEGKDHPMYGIKGKDNPNYGKKRSVDTRKKISKGLIGNKNGCKKNV